MIPRPPRSTLPATLFPATTLFRSRLRAGRRADRQSRPRHGAQDVRAADPGEPRIRYGVCYRDTRYRTGRTGRPPIADGTWATGFGVALAQQSSGVAMLIDTHCHLDAAEFDADRRQELGGAQCGAGVCRSVEISVVAV